MTESHDQSETAPDDLVIVHQAHSSFEAQTRASALRAQGIDAYVDGDSVLLPRVVDTSERIVNVQVRASDEAEARELLEAAIDSLEEKDTDDPPAVHAMPLIPRLGLIAAVIVLLLTLIATIVYIVT